MCDVCVQMCTHVHMWYTLLFEYMTIVNPCFAGRELQQPQLFDVMRHSNPLTLETTVRASRYVMHSKIITVGTRSNLDRRPKTQSEKQNTSKMEYPTTLYRACHTFRSYSFSV